MNNVLLALIWAVILVVESTKAWNRHPNSKFEYILFGIPNMLFRIPNTYLEFCINAEIIYS